MDILERVARDEYGATWVTLDTTAYHTDIRDDGVFVEDLARPGKNIGWYNRRGYLQYKVSPDGPCKGPPIGSRSRRRTTSRHSLIRLPRIQMAYSGQRISASASHSDSSNAEIRLHLLSSVRCSQTGVNSLPERICLCPSLGKLLLHEHDQGRLGLNSSAITASFCF